ncbi:MAG: alpha-mannosidase [Candidatus Helarchaeota archaeon]
MIDEILQSPSLDRFLKLLDKRNFFYPGAKILGTILKKFLWKYKTDDYNIYAIGQSHLDAAWLWRRIDTIHKNDITFSNALRHMDDYPFFTFSCSSAQYYEWMETYFPEKFEQIKKRVKEGRIELVGGMWIEPDLNCTSGESLVRQRLYGQRYYLEKFGKMSEIGWLTDSFGYNWALPQILAKSGSKYFYTNKMSWNTATQFPFIIFYWQAPDGSKVLTYSMPYALNLIVNKPGVGEFKEYTGFLENLETQRVFNYASDYEVIAKRRTGEYIKDLGLVYGMGDGGGGPLRIEIILLKEMLRHKLIKGFTTMGAYLKKIERFKDRLPIWNDELYLEIHRGTYTSQVWLKKLNRKTEFALYNLEVIASLASLLGWEYPKEKLQKLWKLLLFNQFHDILPGSAIPEVYYDTRADFEKIYKIIPKIQQSAIKKIIEQMNLPKNGLIVFNTFSWNRNAVIELKNQQKSIIKDKNGNEINSQLTGNNQIFIANNIPSFGYTYFSLEPAETLPEYQTDLGVQEDDKTITLENTYLKLQIDKTTGHVLSIYHKILDKEVLTAPGNRVQIFKEKMTPMNPAWNINPTYHKHPLNLQDQITVSIKEKGPVRTIIEIQRKSESPSTEIIQQISLLSNTDRIDFKLFLKYHIKSTIVKLMFPFNVVTDKIHCEIPFGTITRSIKPKTKAQKAQWEFPAHKWVDVSQEDYGVTLINKSRYGFDAHFHPKYKSIVRMTILRIPVYPHAGNPIMSILPSKKWHEQSEYSVDYSLYIHKGDWRDAQSYLPAYEFNNPPLQIPVTPNRGALPQEFAFFQVSPTNIIASALKIPEDPLDHAIILRLYEAAGKETEANIKFSNLISIEDASETDLLELNPKQLEFEKDSLKILLKPFEIKTLLIKYNVSDLTPLNQ